MKTLALALLVAAAAAQAPEKPAAPPPGEQQVATDAGAPQSPRQIALAQATDQAKRDVDFAAIHLHAAKLYLT
ncbi:MAG TPA: hypothetical protein VG496_07580, partial [Myxococcales bacterium]|nr:hypothetical protein [Myxococcales bacterium]